MPLTDYTSYDEVRAALGVSAEELEDETLQLDFYSISLTAELEDIADTLVSGVLDVLLSDHQRIHG